MTTLTLTYNRPPPPRTTLQTLKALQALVDLKENQAFPLAKLFHFKGLKKVWTRLYGLLSSPGKLNAWLPNPATAGLH